MALFEDVLKGGGVLTTLAIGVGVVVLAPIVIPMIRPLAKSAIKAGVVAYDQGRMALAELTTAADGVIAEARAEMAEAARAGSQEA
jgi:hypothetical protein